MNPLPHWRAFADRFRCVTNMVHRASLPKDYEPKDLIDLCNTPISQNERRVFQFLLHVWNRHEFPFELSEIIGWDEQHHQEFINWVTGQTLNQPCRYF